MATDRTCLRIDLSEADAAIGLLMSRIDEATSAELERLSAGVIGVAAGHPAWISKEFHGGGLHVVPGPKLLELLAPMASVRAALGACKPD